MCVMKTFNTHCYVMLLKQAHNYSTKTNTQVYYGAHFC
jgi:hypothetical protein